MKFLIILFSVLLNKVIAEGVMFQFGLADKPDPPTDVQEQEINNLYSDNIEGFSSSDYPSVNLDEMVNVVYVTEDPTTVYVTITETVTIPLTTKYVMVNNPNDITITTTKIETFTEVKTTDIITKVQNNLTSGSSNSDINNKNPQVIDYSNLSQDNEVLLTSLTEIKTSTNGNLTKLTNTDIQSSYIENIPELTTTTTTTAVAAASSSNFRSFSSYVNNTLSSADVISTTSTIPYQEVTSGSETGFGYGFEMVIGDDDLDYQSTNSTISMSLTLTNSNSISNSRSSSKTVEFDYDYGYDNFEQNSNNVENKDEFTGFPQFNEQPLQEEFTYINESSNRFEGPLGLFIQMIVCQSLFLFISSIW